MTSQATFQLQVVDSVPVVVVTGEIDLSNIGEFKAFVAQATAGESEAVVISLSGVSYLDSHVLAALADLSKRLQTNRRNLLVCAAEDSAARRILRLSGFDEALPVFESETEALKSTGS